MNDDTKSIWTNNSALEMPKYKSRLTINSNFILYFYRPRPNWWWRLWYGLLLGWKWEKL
jgi:hypothetical protein